MAACKDAAKTVCFVAFNKAIAEELQGRVPAGCQAMTCHSMGFSAVKNAFGARIGVDQYRTQAIIEQILGGDIRDLRREKPALITVTEKLVGLCKVNLNDGTDLDPIIAHFEIDLEDCDERMWTLVPEVLERSKDVLKDGKIDFNDMIWLPVVLNLPIYRYDLLLVDEAQDLNRCQQAMIKRAGARLILCGDPKQAIYGFAGADSESMSRMEEELVATQREGQGCEVLPLTVTRRCGKAIVKEANKIVADFQAHETNGEGKVWHMSYGSEGKPSDSTYHKETRDGDMILCRVNAPLVSQCFKFIKMGRKATIAGRDIGQGLISTIKKLEKKGARNVEELVAALGDWADGETRKEQAKKFPSEMRLIAITDRYECLLAFTEDAVNIDGVVSRINAIFTDDKHAPGVRLSSIHKAKGLEAHRVFLLEPEGASVPHPMASSAWQVEQEYNLRYVAITRAIDELVFVG